MYQINYQMIKKESYLVDIKVVIPQSLIGKRLDKAVSILIPEYSREQLKKWILSGTCYVNGVTCKPKYKVLGGEYVTIVTSLFTNVFFRPEKLSISIVYEDKDVIIVNKQANLAVHPSHGVNRGTLANGLLYFHPSLKNIPRAGIVHRLDKDTTGVMIVAKNLNAYNSLVEQWKNKSIIKIYDVIIWGKCLVKGIINQPIGRSVSNRVQMNVSNNGKQAITHYMVLERFRYHTYIKALIETGRTHQIRVHMSYLNHDVVGDKLYRKNLRFTPITPNGLFKYLQIFPRQALHSKQIIFKHPSSNKIIDCKVNAPKDFSILLNLSRKYSNYLHL